MSMCYAEAAKEEDGAAEPMEQGEEAEDAEEAKNKEAKPPAAVAPKSQDGAKPVEKEKGEPGRVCCGAAWCMSLSPEMWHELATTTTHVLFL